MDDLGFYVLFTVCQSHQDDLGNQGENEKLCATEPHLRRKRSSVHAGLEPRTARSAGKRLTY